MKIFKLTHTEKKEKYRECKRPKENKRAKLLVIGVLAEEAET